MDNTVVLDYGTHTLKAGIAANFPNEHEPTLVTPSAVLDSENRLRPAVAAGSVCDWEAFESLLHFALYEELGWKPGDEGSLVVCEPLFNPRADREYLTHILFEAMQANGVFLQDTAVLSLYAIGKLTGCVVDLGHGKWDIAPVSEGQLQPQGAWRLGMTGEKLTEHVKSVLGQRGISLSHSDAESIKEKYSSVCNSEQAFRTLINSQTTPAESHAHNATSPSSKTPPPTHNAHSSSGPPPPPPGSVTHVLPDGNTIEIQGSDCALFGEALFDTSLVGGDGPGIAEAACDCALSQGDPSLRRQLVENMLVCGGGSGMTNLNNRMFKEMQQLVPTSLQVGICTAPEYLPEKKLQMAPWMGGAVLSKVISQQGHFVTKAEYDESGPIAIHRKC